MVRARRPSPGIKPWVGTKISATIIDFGEPLLAQLPPQASREQGEQVFNLIILFWNALVMERSWGQPEHRAAILAQLADPIHGIPEALEAFESLRCRHELPRFVDDPRAVGEWRIRVTANGQWTLRCDARLPPSLSPST